MPELLWSPISRPARLTLQSRAPPFELFWGDPTGLWFWGSQQLLGQHKGQSSRNKIPLPRTSCSVKAKQLPRDILWGDSAALRLWKALGQGLQLLWEIQGREADRCRGGSGLWPRQQVHSCGVSWASSSSPSGGSQSEPRVSVSCSAPTLQRDRPWEHRQDQFSGFSQDPRCLASLQLPLQRSLSEW